MKGKVDVLDAFFTSVFKVRGFQRFYKLAKSVGVRMHLQEMRMT